MEAACWQVVGASVRGAGHEKTGQPCQDAHAWLQTPAGVLLAAVADGAGSAAQSEIGAATAARSAVERLRCIEAGVPSPDDTPGWRAFLLSGLQAAQEAVEVEAAALQTSARELATTLVLAAATPNCVAVAQVGDGAVVVADRQGNLTALSPPPSGEHLNETTFLVSPDALDTASCFVWQGDAAYLALLSDGLQMLALKMPEGAPHAPFFAPLFRFASDIAEPAAAQAQLEVFLRSSRIAERTDDDLTLLLAASAGTGD